MYAVSVPNGFGQPIQFPERLSHQPAERPGMPSQTLSRRTTLLYCTLLITLGLAGSLLGPAIPTLAENTGSTIDRIAWLFTAKAFGAMGGAFLLGRLYDRFSGHKLIAVILLLLLPTLALIPFVHNLNVLLCIMLVGGICEGTLHVGTNTLIVRLHGERVPPYMNALHFSFGIGATAAPMLLGLSFDFGGGIAWPFVGVPLLMTFLFPFFLRTPTPEGTPPTDSSPALPPPRVILPILIGLLFFFYAGVEGSLSGWVYSYALDLKLADKASAAWLTSLLWGGLTLGRLCAVPLSRRFAPRHILLVDLVGGGIILCGIALFGGTYQTLAIGVVAYGLAIASVFPTIMAFAGSRMAMTGNVTGWFFVGASLGGMLFPWLVGQFFVSYGPQAMLMVAGGTLVLGLAVFGWIMRETARKVER